MSKRSRHGNDFAPSTFPFLAVLLCVIGALVLLLVINVTNSRASAKNQVQDELSQALEQAKEQSDYLVSISEELRARRELIKKQIESRRSELTRTEDHIDRLEAQIQDALARLKALQDSSSRANDAAEKQAQIAELKQQIILEKKKLSEQIAKRKDQTPAFSIIPYDGNNRTTRRPVYLECTEAGVVIQPEGILISIEDLGPPHGPGNPLDAALRVLRTAYQAKDAVYGITIPPYPLLLVRPDGIHTYALARSAMAGWDDQFGYELIDAQMPLAYPDGVPELKDELTKALDVAKDRQRALVAALPARYSRNPFSAKNDDNWDSIDARTSANSSNARYGQDNQKQGSSISSVDESQNNRRWQMIREMPSDPNQPASERALSNSVSANPFDANQVGSIATDGSSKLDDIGSLNNLSGQSIGSNQDQTDRSGSESAVDSSIQSQGTQQEGSVLASNASGRSASSRFSSATSGSSTGSAAAGPMAEEAQMEQALREQAMKQSQQETATSKRQDNSQRGSSPRNISTESELKPISLTAGKDWATTRMDNRSTPVSRPIRMIVLEDRWLMCREGKEWKYDAEILLELGPQAASEQLQQAIRDRVDSWGLSLPGGYWVPTLTVQAAADADQSVQRMQKLLEGSGVVIRVQPLTTPTPKK
ncbi:MAG: hypothetical protein ACKOAU_00595 [Pirellula sp.]